MTTVQISAVDLLERTIKPNEFDNFDDILEYLHSGVEDDYKLKNDGYCDALEKVCTNFGFDDAIDLNIYIEQKLMEYELKWKNADNVPTKLATEYITLLNIGREDRKVSNYLPFYEIVNEIKQIAAERGIELPQEENTITWAVSAIKFLTSNENTIGNTNEDTALRDLRFAHAYLTRQYTEHVQSESNRLRDTTNKLQQATQRILDLESEKASMERELNDRAKENYELTLQNALLKVDHIGSPSSPNPSSSNDNLTPPATADTPSVRILRAQFKRQVEELHSKFESELQRLKEHYEGTDSEHKT